MYPPLGLTEHRVPHIPMDYHHLQTRQRMCLDLPSCAVPHIDSLSKIAMEIDPFPDLLVRFT